METPLCQGSTDIADFFDPYDEEHIKAWECLQNTGTWPQKFIEGHKITITWEWRIKNKICKAWVRCILDRSS